MVKTKTHTKISTDEPRWNSNKPEEQICEMLNWYSYNKNSDDALKYFLEYLKESGEKEDSITKISECSKINFSSSIGWLSRIYFINQDVLPSKYISRLEQEKKKILQIVSSKQTEKQEIVVAPKTQKPTIQEHIENQLLEFLAEISTQIDKFLLNDYVNDFSMYEWLKTQQVKHQQTKNIIDYIEKTVLSEILEAQSGTCPQLSEAYAFMSKSQMKKFVVFLKTLVEDGNKWLDVAKQISISNRAPRVKKPKPPLKQISKLKFLREHENLKSVLATSIVGASQLWVYNVKTRMLGVYICNNVHGFSVKGSTILNFDAKESISKKLRKPEDVIPNVLESGKVALRKILPNIRAKEKALTGRINKDTILLKAL